MSFFVALGMAPGMALATTGSGYVGGKTDTWQMFYAKGKNASVTPAFDLYLGSEKVDASKYTVSYQLTYWDDDSGKDIATEWAKPLVPSASPVADSASMSSEYRTSLWPRTATAR